MAETARTAAQKIWWAATLALLVVAAAGIALTLRADGLMGDDEGRDADHEGGKYAIGPWGDLPYSELQAMTGVPNLIADMNSQEPAFTAHDGDLKAGNGTPNSTTPTTCSDTLYQQALGYFNSLPRGISRKSCLPIARLCQLSNDTKTTSAELTLSLPAPWKTPGIMPACGLAFGDWFLRFRF